MGDHSVTKIRVRAAALFACGVCVSGAGQAATFTTLAPIRGSGDGAAPLAAMINVGGTLYGTAPASGSVGCGAVYSFNPTSGKESIVYAFKGGSDGCAPQGALLHVDGKLYGTTYSGGTGGGTVFQIDVATGAETILHAFAGGADGANPTSALIQAKGRLHDQLYGTTTIGGRANQGTVFSIDLVTHSEAVVYGFVGQGDGGTPSSALLGVDGLLYGTALFGGAAGAGTVYSIDPVTGSFATVYSFTNQRDGGYPVGGVIRVDDILYGTASTGAGYGNGAVFKIDRKTGREKVVYSLTSEVGPQSPLLYIDGTLYGTTVSGGPYYFGTLYSVNLATGVGRILHGFGAGGDGANPAAAPINVDGTLYGASETGGSGLSGGLYSYSLASGQESLVYSFTGANNAESDGGFTKVKTNLFAAVAQGGASSEGEVISISPYTNAVHTVYSFAGGNGVYPSAAMVELHGLLYGTTKSGGTMGQGTVFAYNPATGTQKVIYSFTGGNDGGTPYAGLAVVDGKLYGATALGGINYAGTVFEVTTSGHERVLHAFTGGADGAAPYAGLINVGGTLYGTTDAGGNAYYGVLFSIDPKTGVETPLHNFTGGNDGGIPSSSLLNVGGVLYGVAIYGGSTGNGVVYSYNPATSTETVVHAFAGGADGDAPDAALLQLGGTLYGVTSGDFGGYGTIFKIDLASGAESVLYSFTGGSDGGNPNTGLAAIGGTIYGMTATGGAANLGAVFSLTP
jgi:uncharacterized repeat protein (TIGR03803 family)